MGLVCAACALLALPATAGAKPHYFVKAKSLHLGFSVPASKGYKVSVQTRGHRQVSIQVHNEDFIAVYKTVGHVSRKGIEANLGRLGHISLRFRGKHRLNPKRFPGLKLPPPLRQHCRGRRPVSERGVFVGNIRFLGERGYTRAVAHRLKGEVVRTYKRICRHGSARASAGASRRKHEPEFIILGAAAKERGVSRFYASAAIVAEEGRGKRPGKGLSLDIAGRIERVEGVAIVKLVLLLNEDLSLLASPPSAKTVTVEATPPEPFAGTGTYLEERGQPPSWSGTLGIHLPGNGLVPLTGPEFEVELCRGSTEQELEQCEEGPSFSRPLLEPLRGARFSGQWLPLPALRRGQALLAEVAAELV